MNSHLREVYASFLSLKTSLTLYMLVFMIGEMLLRLVKKCSATRILHLTVLSVIIFSSCSLKEKELTWWHFFASTGNGVIIEENRLYLIKKMIINAIKQLKKIILLLAFCFGLINFITLFRFTSSYKINWNLEQFMEPPILRLLNNWMLI